MPRISLMETFASEYRTNKFFRDLAISEIYVTYRAMEYLNPDSMEKYDTNPETLKLLLECSINPRKYAEAANKIIEECNIFIDSGHWNSSLINETVKLIEILLPEYIKSKTTEKEKKRLELLKELKELDEDKI